MKDGKYTFFDVKNLYYQMEKIYDEYYANFIKNEEREKDFGHDKDYVNFSRMKYSFQQAAIEFVKNLILEDEKH